MYSIDSIDQESFEIQIYKHGNRRKLTLFIKTKAGINGNNFLMLIIRKVLCIDFIYCISDPASYCYI